jgi:hypothetical protein
MPTRLPSSGGLFRREFDLTRISQTDVQHLDTYKITLASVPQPPNGPRSAGRAVWEDAVERAAAFC